KTLLGLVVAGVVLLTFGGYGIASYYNDWWPFTAPPPPPRKPVPMKIVPRPPAKVLPKQHPVQQPRPPVRQPPRPPATRTGALPLGPATPIPASSPAFATGLTDITTMVPAQMGMLVYADLRALKAFPLTSSFFQGQNRVVDRAKGFG